MKKQVTRKMIKNTSNYIIAINYRNAQNLLKGYTANSYCAGVYGWDCDNYDVYIYNLGFVTISTGYRPIKSKNINESDLEIYELIKSYDDLAKNTNDVNELDALLQECITKILNNEVIA